MKLRGYGMKKKFGALFISVFLCVAVVAIVCGCVLSAGSGDSPASNLYSDSPASLEISDSQNLFHAENHDHSGMTELTEYPADGTLSSGSYYLGTDISGNLTVSGGRTEVTLCLNSHNITGNGSDAVVSVTAIGAKLILCDCTGSGHITNGNKSDGGGVFVSFGTFEMQGGTISGNTATSNGGGVFLCNSGVFTMSGGTISGNTATSGGGVTVGNFCTFNMSGGEISGNTATSGGGVYLNPNASFNVSGTPKITGNHPDGNGSGENNVHVIGNINVTGELKDGAQIGVTVDSMRETTTFTTGYGYGNSEKPNYNVNPSKYFLSDNSEYAVGLSDDGEAALVEPVATVATVTVGTDTVGSESIGEAFSYANTHGTEAHVATVTLKTDVTTGVTLGVSSYVTLELDGWMLKTTGSGSVITVAEGGYFTLQDSNSGNRTHKYTVSDGLWVFGDSGKDFEGGVITGGYTGIGGGVCVSGGIFVMTGGAICGNTSTGTEGGGGVCVNGGGRFTLTDGKICGNNALAAGGVEVFRGTFEMTGGEISYNTATGNGGGGVSVDNSGSFEMRGGEIKDNAASGTQGGGGGVGITAGTFTMYGTAKITGNSANYGGGGVGVKGGTFTMTGGEISANSAGLGGGVGVSGGTFNVSGNPKITGNNVSGSSGVASNVYLLKTAQPALDNKIHVTAPLTSGAQIGVGRGDAAGNIVTGAFTTGNGGGSLSYFRSDRKFYLVEISGTEAALVNPAATVKSDNLNSGEETGFGAFEDAWAAASLNGEQATATVKMYSDYESKSQLESVARFMMVLDLNGYVLNLSGGTLGYSNTLTLTDSDSSKENTVDGKTVTGGVITGADIGVRIDSHNTFNMEGGSIINCTTGVKVYEGCTFSVSGSPKIYGNGTNVDLGSEKITVTGALESGAQIGVTYTGSGDFTTGYGAQNGSTEPYNFFFDDNGEKAVVFNATRTEATFSGDDATVSVKIGDGMDVLFVSPEEAFSYANDESIASSGTTATVTLLTDIVTSSTVSVHNGANIIFDLNGYVLRRSQSAATGSVVQIDGGTFILKDSNYEKTNNVNGVTLPGGVLTGGNTQNGGGVYITSGTFILNRGNIFGNSAKYGGGVYVSGGARFDMEGGTVSGNTALRSGEVDDKGNPVGGVGGGVCLWGNSDFQMIGGTVSDNSADIDGGGVYVYYVNGTGTSSTVTKATFSVFLTPVVSGNKVGDKNNNVYLPSGAVINVIGGMYEGTKIGVTLGTFEGTGVFTDGGYGTYNSGTVPSEFFFSDNPNLAPMLNGDTAELGNKTATVKIGTDGEEIAFAKLEEAFGYGNKYGISEENTALVCIVAEYGVREVFYSLNGYITLTGGWLFSSLLEVNGTFTLDGGYISEGSVEVLLGGTFRMTGGTITSGSTVTVSNGGTFGMTGGKIAYESTVTVSNGGTFEIEGAPNIYAGGAHVSPDEGAKITVTGALKTEDGDKAGIRVDASGVFTENYGTHNTDTEGNIIDPNEYFIPYDSAYIAVPTAYGEVELVPVVATVKIGEDVEPVVKFGDFAEAWAYANQFGISSEKTATLTMLADFNLNNKDKLEVGYSNSARYITLDLNGNVLSRPNKSKDNIYIDNGSKFSLKNSGTTGSISGGYYGVNISGGTFEMSGGEIRDGVSGVNVYNGTFEMSGGEISGNGMSYGGGGVWLEGGTFNMSGGTITANSYGVNGRSGTFNVSGAPKIYGNSSHNVYFIGYKIGVSGALEEGAQIGVSGSEGTVFTEGYSVHNGSTAPYNFFFDDEGKKAVCFNSTNTEAQFAKAVATVKVGTQDEIKFADFMKAWDYAKAYGTENAYAIVTLLDNVTIEETVTEWEEVYSLKVSSADYITLDLNGKVLTKTNTLLVYGNFTLTDSSSSGGGKITGGSSIYGVCVNSGTFVMENGELSGNYGGVWINGGEFTMSGGSIKDNTDGVIVGEHGEFTMSGGSIKDNTDGVAVFSFNESYGKFNVSGAPVISGNTGKNVYLNSGTKITVTGKLEKDGVKAKIGVTLTTNYGDGVFTAGYGTNHTVSGNTTPPDTYFFADDNAYMAVLDDTSKQAKLVLIKATVQLGSDPAKNFESFDMAWNFAKNNGNASKPATLTLLDNAETSSTRTVGSGVVMVLDLNGFVLTKTGTGNGAVIKVQGGNFSLDDSRDFASNTVGALTVEGGALTGGKQGGVYVESGTFTMLGGYICGNTFQNGRGGGVYVSGTFNMNGGTITGNSATGSPANANGYGGGVFVVGTFNMYGGTIRDNTASTSGGGVFVDGGTFNIRGYSVISGNLVGGVESNVYLPGQIKINVCGALKDIDGNYARIGVTLGSYDNAFTTDYALYNKDTDNKIIEPKNYFFPDDDSYMTVLSGEQVKFVKAVATVKLGDEGETQKFQNFYDAWQYAKRIGTEENSAILTMYADYTGFTETRTVDEGEFITLDLNGFMVKKQGTGGSVFSVSGKFTLRDSNRNSTRYYTVNSYGLWVFGATAETQNAKEFKGGVITGGYVSGNVGGTGGGVNVSGGGSFYMEGGAICGNTAANDGGGVYVSGGGSFYMENGAICGNRTTTISGGGVYVDSSGRFEMSGGEISGNRSARYGGGVYVNGSTFVMSGGEISGNEATYNGGGVFVMYSRTVLFEISGASVIYGNKGGNGDNNVYLSSTSLKITVTGALKDSDGNKAKIGVILASGYSGAFTTGYGTNNDSDGSVVSPDTYFYADSEKLMPALNSDNEVILSGAAATVRIGKNGEILKFATFAAAWTFANSNGISENETATVKMFADANSEYTLEVSDGRFITLDLNGYILRHAGDSGEVIKVVSGTFTLTDSNTEAPHTYRVGANGIWEFGVGSNEFKGGVITGGNNTGGNGGGVNVSGGTVVMLGGAICGNNAWVGGGVYVDNGTFEMYGGKIAGNTASGGGGVGVGIHENSTFEMTDGEISDNTASGDGGGVLVSTSGKFIMSGGVITRNKTTGNGGGVHVWNEFEINGAPVIYGNKKDSADNNVTLGYSDTVITVTDELGDGAIIGISTTGVVVTSGYGEKVGTVAPYTYFTPDNKSYAVTTETVDGYEEIKLLEAVANVETGEGVNAVTVNFATVADAWSYARENGTSEENTAFVTLMKNASSSATLEVRDGEFITLDLNGNNLTMPGNSSNEFEIEGYFALNGSSGILTCFDVQVKGTFEMSGGTLVTTEGVYVYSGCEFTMSGGTISGCSSDGVCISYNSTFKISGTPVITDNGGDNVYLETGAKITVTGKLMDGAQIGVTLESGYEGEFTEGYGTFNSVNGTVVPPYHYFISDNSGLAPLLDGSEVKLSAVVATVKIGQDVPMGFASLDYAWEVAKVYGNSSQRAEVTLLDDISVSDTLGVDSGEYIALNLNGCKLTKTGGGQVIDVRGNLILNDSDGGTITGGSTGVYVGMRGTFTMNGGTISGNTAQGVYVYGGTFTMTGGTVTGNGEESNVGGVRVYYGTFNVSGNPVITGNIDRYGVERNVYLGSGEKITVTAPLTYGAKIGVMLEDGYEGEFTEGYDCNSLRPYNFFLSDKSGLAATLKDGEVVLAPSVASVKLGSNGVTVIFGNIDEAWGCAKLNGNSDDTAFITLLVDCEPAAQLVVDSGEFISLDLGGKTLTLEDELTVSGNLTLEDTTGYGTIIGDFIGVWVNGGGEFTMTGGTISDCDSTGVWVNGGGEFTMTGGTIIGHNIGVWVYGGGEFTMTGGTISGCGTGVRVDEDGEFTMTGGTVTHNSDGVDVFSFNGRYGVFNVSGAVDISGNTVSNVWLSAGTKITVTGPLEKDGVKAKIGVDLRSGYEGEFTTGYREENSVNGEVITPYHYFFADNPDFAPTLDQNGEEVILAPVLLSVSIGAGEPIGFAALSDAWEFALDFGEDSDNAATVTLLHDVETAHTLYIVYQYIILDLNGYVLSTSGNGSVVYLEDSAAYLRLTDSDSLKNNTIGQVTLQGGVITGANNSDQNGGGVFVNFGTFEMRGGSIYGNSAECGGGVYVSQYGTFNVSGDPKVFGNLGGNVYLENGNQITVTDSLSAGAHIGVYNNGKVVTGFIQNADPAQFFFPDISDYNCVYVSNKVDGVVTVTVHSAVTDNAVDATCTETGLTEGSHCSLCHNVLVEQETIPLNPDNHTAATAWSKNDDYHWNECANGCGAELDKAAHTGGTATCTERATCSACGEKHGAVDPDNHTAATTWTSDGAEHWHECTNGCYTKLDKAAHTGGTATCTERATCTACGEKHGAVDPDNHTAATEWSKNDDYHWHECANGCGTKLDKAAHTGGTATCTERATCSACGEKYGEVDGNNHSAATTWTTDGAEHWHECTNGCDTKLDKAAHTGGTATCTDEAECSACGEKYGEPDTDNHDLVHHDDQPATCSEPGWEAYDSCSRCDYSTYTEIPETGHDYGDWVTVKEPTCTEKGSKTRVCQNDEEHVETVEIPATGHSYGEWTVTKQATVDEEGEERRVCQNDGCSHVETRVVPKLQKPADNTPQTPDENKPQPDYTVAVIVLAIIVLLEVAYLVFRGVRSANADKQNKKEKK